MGWVVWRGVGGVGGVDVVMSLEGQYVVMMTYETIPLCCIYVRFCGCRRTTGI